MNDDLQTKAVNAYDAARSRVAKCDPGDKASENAYGIAYQKLVQLGLASQVKRKYRG